MSAFCTAKSALRAPSICSYNLSNAVEFEFESARYLIDDRQDYGETRIRALGLFDGRVHALVFTEIAGGIRVISFRKANKREVVEYEKTSSV